MSRAGGRCCGSPQVPWVGAPQGRGPWEPIIGAVIAELCLRSVRCGHAEGFTQVPGRLGRAHLAEEPQEQRPGRHSANPKHSLPCAQVPVSVWKAALSKQLPEAGSAPGPLGQGQRRCGWNLRVQHPQSWPHQGLPVVSFWSGKVPWELGRTRVARQGSYDLSRARPGEPGRVVALASGLCYLYSVCSYKSVLWGLCSVCGVWPTASSLPAADTRGDGMSPGLQSPWPACVCSLLTAPCLLFWLVFVSLCLPTLFPHPCPLMEASWKLTVWDRTAGYILWSQWPPALLLRF